MGTRGIGKTILLNQFGDRAQEQGWHVFDETATKGFTSRLRDAIFQRIKEIGRTRKIALSNINLNLEGFFGIGATFESIPEHLPNYTLRMAVEDLLALQRELDRQANQAPAGILLTVDELP